MTVNPGLLLASSVAIAAAAIVPALAQTAPNLPVVTYTPLDAGDCATADPSGYRGTIAVLTCTCAGGANTGGSVWGTDVYTDDSAICAAAQHRGVIGSGGGRVTFQIQDGQASYRGTARNGVESGNYGEWSGSYQFVAVGGEGAAALAEIDRAAALGATDVGVCDTAVSWRNNGGKLTCTCPAGSNNSRSVWGTDTYTDDSYICKAAIHAGAITNGRGGRVTIELVGGLGSYRASTRNGVSTSNFGSWSGSYRFVK